MQFSFIDQNVSTTVNVFLVIANIFNIHQLVKLNRPTILVAGFYLWESYVIAYAVAVNSFLMLLNNIVTVFSSIIVGWFKQRFIRTTRPSMQWW